MFTSGSTMNGLGVLNGDTAKLTIKPSTTEDIASNEAVGFTVSVDALSSGVKGYTITVDIGDTSKTVKLSGSILSQSFSVNITENVVIGAAEITVVPTYNLTASAALSNEDKTVTLTFNQAIDKTTSTITADDLGYSGSAIIDESSIEVSADGKTVTFDCVATGSAFATSETFSLTGISAEDDTFGTNSVSSPVSL